MNLMRRTLQHSDVARAFTRAPLECAASVAVAVCISYGIEAGDIGEEIAHVCIAGFLIVILAWAATMAHAVRLLADRRRTLATAAAGMAGLLYYILTPGMSHEAEGWRALSLCVSACALALAVPGFAKLGASRDFAFRRINSRFLLRAIGIGLYGLALFAGLAVALAAVDNLFDLHMHGEVYMHVYAWIMAVLVPWAVFGAIDDYVRDINEESNVARVVYRLATYLFPPLVAIYFLILCAYGIRIAITHELPRNLVSPMVIAAGVLSAVASIVFDPEHERSPALRWLRFTPVIFILIAPLGWWAVFMRFNDYGWTEFRLLRLLVLAVLTALALGALSQMVTRRQITLRAIPLVMGIALALAGTGPWGVLPTARRSQQHRLLAAMKEAKLDVRSAVQSDTATRVVPKQVYAQIRGSAMYLQSHFGGKAVTDVVPAYSGNQDIIALYRLMPAGGGADVDNADYVFGELPFNVGIPVPDGVIHRVDATATRGAARSSPRVSGQWTSHDSLYVVVGSDTLTASLGAVIDAVRPDQRNMGQIPLGAGAVPVHATTGEPGGYLIIIDIAAQRQDGRPIVTHVSGILKLKGKTP
jgi:hypothetical protein